MRLRVQRRVVSGIPLNPQQNPFVKNLATFPAFPTS